jgi:hypothetical protein
METIAAPAVPRPIPVGAEMAALARFYPDATWSGRIVEGGMGPGTPAMRAEGRGRHELIEGSAYGSDGQFWTSSASTSR